MSIRDGDIPVEINGSREPDPRDDRFLHPHMSVHDFRTHETTDEEYNEFLENSTFDGSDLMPDLRKEWSGHLLIYGPTGSGKTYLCGKLLDDDVRPVYLVSDIRKRDPSLKWVQRSGRLRRLSTIPRPEEIRNSFILFDDVTNKEWLQFRDMMFQQGRHYNITCLAIIHEIFNGTANRHIINDAEWICMFPQSNRARIIDFLERKYRLKARFRSALISQAAQDGRYLFIHNWAPTFAMSSKFVIPF